MCPISTESYDRSRHEYGDHAHMVYFSEHDASLITTVSSFLAAGLQRGESCIVVATPSHRESLEKALCAEGIFLAEAMAIGTYLSFDAATILSRILIDGQPDRVLFTEVLEAIIDQVLQRHRQVHIFGEMVALLWAQGNLIAAIRLENLWNELGKKHAFSLLCAYPIQDFNPNSHEAAFDQICQLHSRLVPSTSYTQLSEEERLRKFILLQQKAYALEREIAESRVAQDRLRVLAAIVESSDDAILSKDLEGVVTSWNSAAQLIYGYTAQEMIGSHVTRIFPPGRHEEFEQIMARIRRGERVDHFETHRVCKDGRQILVSVTISPVRDETGVIRGASSIAHDITEQRHLEVRSQRLFASNVIGIFVTDEAGTILEVNQAFLDLLGYTREEWQESPQNGTISSSLLASFLQPLLQSANPENALSDPQETTLQHKSGRTISVLVALTPIEYTETCIGFVLDISARKALEQRKDIFIGMASHELKTPVTSLKGFLGLLQRTLVQQNYEKVQHYLTRMDAQIEKLTKLINDLLDISKIQADQMIYRVERVDVDPLVQEIIESVQETTQTHLLQLEGASQASMFGDRDRLGQVLINLLNNAIKYSPDAKTVIVYLNADKEQVLISVQDFGLGIDKEHHEKIFERFYQVTTSQEKTYPGLGIGLAISHEIVKRHKGHLWVESEYGKGATFHLSLPLMQQEGNEERKLTDAK